MEERSVSPRHPLRPLPSLAGAYLRSIPGKVQTHIDRDRCSTLHRDIERLYRSEELPSIYYHSTFDLPIDKTDLDEPKKNALFVEWDHDLDPQNPLHWPTWKKSLNVSCIFLMCIVSPFTSSVFAPAIPDLTKEFKATDLYLPSFVLSIYVLGYAIGPLLISPLSEIFGRVPLYHLCNTLFSISTLLCGTTNSLGTLAVARLFAGMGGSAVFALAPSSIADMFPPKKRGAIIALVAIGYNLGPSVSPTAGSYINAAWGWRWVFYIASGIGIVITVLNFAGLSETYEPVLLRGKATRLRRQKRVKDGSFRSRYNFNSNTSMWKVLGTAMLMPLRMFVLSKTILLTSGLTAIGYGWIYILYTIIPRTFLITYAWEPKNIGLAYLGTALGALIGMIAAAKTSDAVVNRRNSKGDNRPEIRLLPMCFFWPLVSSGLFLYAWTAQNRVHVAVPMLGTCIFGAGAMSAILFTGTYIIDAYPVHSASGTAASTLLRSILGGLAPLFSTKMFERLDVGWMSSLLAIVALVVAPVPWIVYRFGEGWRNNEGLSGGARSETTVIQRRGDAGDADNWSEPTIVTGNHNV